MKTASRHSAQRTRQQGGFVLVGILVVLAALGGGHLLMMRGQARAFKVPSLRNVAERAPYMHAGQLTSLAEVLDHYNQPPQAHAGHTELKPLKLNRRELRQLEAFLRALSGGTTSPEAQNE